MVAMYWAKNGILWCFMAKNMVQVVALNDKKQNLKFSNLLIINKLENLYFVYNFVNNCTFPSILSSTTNSNLLVSL